MAANNTAYMVMISMTTAMPKRRGTPAAGVSQFAPVGPLTVDTRDGYIIEIPMDQETWNRLDRQTQEEYLRRMPSIRTVDYEAK